MKIERAYNLFDALDKTNFNINRIISNLYVIGQIDNLDFYGISFYNCKFTETVFTNCSVDNKTYFNNCEFAKFLDFQNCSPKEWSAVKLSETVFHAPTNLDWQNFVGNILGPKEEYIKDALELALKKFWHHGRLKSFISKDDWPKGSLGHSVYRDDILEAMLKVQLIEYIYLAEVKEDVYKFHTESIIDLQHFMDNKQITGKIKDVYDILCKRQK
jgi:hypothetical protein